MAWYRTGSITLTPGSDIVLGVGTTWVQNTTPGGILFTATGLALEVRRIISDTQIQLPAAYSGPALAGVAYGIAPTQAYVPELVASLQTFLGELGDLKQAWLDGSLNGTGAQIRGVVDSFGELPASGNTTGDLWLIGGTQATVWSGTGWKPPFPFTGTVTPEMLLARDQTLAAKAAVIADAEDARAAAQWLSSYLATAGNGITFPADLGLVSDESVVISYDLGGL